MNTLVTSTMPLTLISGAVSVVNSALTPSNSQEIIGPAVSISNSSLGPTTQVLIGPAVSILNSNPLTSQTQQALLPGAATNPLISELRGLSVTLDQSLDGQRVVTGQTITVRGVAAGTESIVAVQFLVNGQKLAADPTSPYELLFTVPFGVDSLTFGAIVTDTAGNQASAAPVGVTVQPDPLTRITGRVVDAAGSPIAGAVVDLLSEGLEAELFEFTQPLVTLPDLGGRTPHRVTRITAVNMRNPNGTFGADPMGSHLAPDHAERFTGWINITTAGAHRFWLGAHEGARLKVAGVTIVDMPTSTGAYQERSGAINLVPGLVPVEITYFEGAGYPELQLSFASPGSKRQVVPPASLVPASQPFVTTADASGTFKRRPFPAAVTWTCAAGQALSLMATLVLAAMGGSALKVSLFQRHLCSMLDRRLQREGHQSIQTH